MRAVFIFITLFSWSAWLLALDSVSLEWDPNSESDLAGYHVYRSTISGSSYSRLTGAPVLNTSYLDTSLSSDTTYFYVVTAINNVGLESGFSNQVSVETGTVPPPNQSPQANGDSAELLEDTQVLIDVLSNDTDADGDELSVVSVERPQHGSAVVQPDGSIQYQPALDFFGGDSFQYTLGDGRNGTDQATVTIQVQGVNDAPVAEDDTVVAGANLDIQIDVLANDYDVDQETPQISEVGVPQDGSVEQMSGGVLLYQPGVDFRGIDQFTYVINDAAGATDTATVTVTVQNLSPTVNAGSYQEVPSGAEVSLLGSASDPEGGAVAIEWSQESGETVALQSTNELSTGFEAPETTTQDKLLIFRLTATDEENASSSGIVTVRVLRNQPPDVEMASAVVALSGSEVVVVASAQDAEGEPLSYEWSQTTGSSVVLDGAGAELRFQAPEVLEGEQLFGFDLRVSDSLYQVTRDLRVRVRPEGEDVLTLPLTLKQGNAKFSDTFVGLAVFNPEDLSKTVDLAGYSSDGSQQTRRNLSEPLANRGQRAFVLSQVLENPLDSTMVLAQGVEGPIQGFFMIGDNQLYRMDGLGAELDGSRQLYFPLNRSEADSDSLLYLVNEGEADPGMEARLYDAEGEMVGTQTIALMQRGSLLATVQEIFGVQLERGYVEVRSDVSTLKGFLVRATPDDFYTLSGRQATNSPWLWVPHFFMDANGGQTQISLLNPTNLNGHVTVTAYDNLGSELSQAIFTVEAGQLFEADVAELLGLSVTEGQLSGYLKLRVRAGGLLSRPPDLISQVIFGGASGTYRAALPMMEQGSSETLFLHVAQSRSLNLFTGMAVLNTSNLSAEVTVEVYDAAGERVQVGQLSIPPEERFVGLLTSQELFGLEFEQVGGHIKVRSNTPVSTFVFFGDYRSQFLGAIQGQSEMF